MKILWFYKYSDRYNFDRWFHLDLVRDIKKYIPIYAYGPDIHNRYSDICLQKYNENITLKELYEQFKFDVIIINTKSRMFDYYNPHSNIAKGSWLPKDFKYFNKPKVVIEEDYHYEKNDDWYNEMNISLVMQRHLNNYILQKQRKKVKTVWLPFSVNENVFKPNYNINRINLICFAGNKTSIVYKFRKKVCNILTENNAIDFCDIDKDVPNKIRKITLLKDFNHSLKEEAYIRCLQQYVSHINGSSIYNITSAKMFEIMSSGSVLFTNNSDYGLKELFYDDSYVTYEEDCSDAIMQARKIIQDKDYREHIAKRGRECILARHTNEIRTKEMINILEKEL